MGPCIFNLDWAVSIMQLVLPAFSSGLAFFFLYPLVLIVLLADTSENSQSSWGGMAER